jgi:hypothetical protein
MGGLIFGPVSSAPVKVMLHRVSYRGANEDPPSYFNLIFDLKKIEF